MKLDMVGMRFGKLTVLKEAYTRKSKHYWLCRCDCGNEKIVEEYHLKSGRTKSCGCLRKQKLRERRISLVGERYGRLVVLGPACADDGSVIGWECQCDCGKRCVCKKGNLRSGMTKSCGCIRDEQRRENMKNAIHFVDGTCVERIANRKTFSNNTTGHRGVYRRNNGSWRASIGFQGKMHYLGTFSCYDDAVTARLEAEKRFYDQFLEAYEQSKTQKDESD